MIWELKTHNDHNYYNAYIFKFNPQASKISNLIKRQIQILAHLEKNHKDQTARRGLRLTESKIDRLIRYYKKTNKLSKDWKYDKTKAKLLVGN